MKVLSSGGMQALESTAVEQGLDFLRLMENAGAAAAHYIRTLPLTGRRVAVLCGKGNNGGDGFVIARKLLEEHFDVHVILTSGTPATAQAREMLSRIENAATHLLDLEEEPYVAAATVKEADLVVDAVYGIGFHGTLPTPVRSLFRLVNAGSAMRIAVDVPSGMEADTGICDPDALAAQYTVTFTAMKPGLLSYAAAGVYGCVEVVSIGIDAALVEQFTAAQTLIDEDMVAACFSPRPSDSHKGLFGEVLCICGSDGMPGAAAFAGRGALCCGAGLAAMALPRSVYPIVAGLLPEAVYIPLPETPAGGLSLRARPLLRERLKTADAVVMGCGLGTGEAVTQVVEDVLRHAACPIVLDADGINAVAGHIDIRKTTRAPLILTPHPGEMARLCGCSVKEVQDNRFALAQQYANEVQAVVVLKGHRTVVAAPGQEPLVNLTGNSGMATGGTGDVLAGIIAGLAAGGMTPYHAAMCAVHLHGLAGDKAAALHSQHGMLPTHLCEELGGLFTLLEK